MSESTGRYHRWALHRERAQYLSVLLQRSSAGLPCYITDADFTDGARITRKLNQRLAQLSLSGVEGPNAWKLVGQGENNNFLLKGGNGTDEGMAGAWVGGLRATLYQDVDYKCERLGAFSSTLADQVHHRYSAISAGQLVDQHAKWTPHVFQGKGLKVQVGGLGLFTITDNTATILTLGDGFDPTGLEPHQYYYFHLKSVVADVDQTVWLDVHIEDWGMAEDPRLNHNPTGTAVEAARRERLVKRVWVQQVVAGEQPTVDYTDSRGARHYMLKLGTIHRVAAQESIAADDVENDREENASSGRELEAARAFRNVCVEDANQPRDLAERLQREGSFLTVGPTTAYPGEFIGGQGLIDALACNAVGPRTVFVKNGTYYLPEPMVIRPGWTVLGESENVILYVDRTLTLADDIAGIQINKYAKLENVLVWRANGTGAADADLIRVDGRRATMERVWVRDDIATGVAVKIEEYESAIGGSVLRDCTIVKTNGCAVEVIQPAIGYDDGTSVAGSFPPISTNTAGTRVSSYGVLVDHCHIQVIDATVHTPTRAAVRVGSADSVAFRGTTIQVGGGQAIYVDAASTASDTPTILEGRGGVSFLGCDVLFSPDNLYNTTKAFVVNLVAGRVRLDDFNVTSLVTTAYRLEAALQALEGASGAALHVEMRRVRVRGIGRYGVRVEGRNGLRASLDSITVSPESTSAGFFLPLVVGCDEDLIASSRIHLTGVFVDCASQTAEGVRLFGPVTASKVYVEGRNVSRQDFLGGDLNGTVTCGVRLYPSRFSAPQLTSGTVQAHGGVGVYVSSANDTGLETCVSNVDVDGESRTAHGFLVQRANPVKFLNCMAINTRGAGLHCKASDNRTQVIGGAYASSGLEWYDGGFPDDSADFRWIWAACLRNPALVSGVTIGRDALGGDEPESGFAFVGITAKGACAIEHCNVAGADYGVLAPSGSEVRINGGEFRRCKYAVYALGASALRMQGSEISESDRTPIWASQVSDFHALGLSVDGAGKAMPLIYMNGCGATRRGAQVIDCNFTAPNNHESAAVVLTGCNWPQLMGGRIRAIGGMCCRVDSGTFASIRQVHMDGGGIGVHSLVVTDSPMLQLKSLFLDYGAKLTNCYQPRIEDLDCLGQGLAVLMASSGSCYLREVRVRNAQGPGLVESCGIFIGSATDRINGTATLENCTVENWQSIGLDRTDDSVDGRSAGIRVALVGSSTTVNLRGCRVFNNDADVRGIGILVGNLDYIADESAAAVEHPTRHCYGVNRLVVDGCEMLGYGGAGNFTPALLVAVLRATAHIIHNCTFHAQTGVVVALYREFEGSDALYARVDFKGNSSLRRPLSFADGNYVPYVEQARYTILDGGMTNEGWNAYRWADDSTHGWVSVAAERTNSVRPYTSDVIDPDGTLPSVP